MIVTISGTPGAGKTTVCRMLEEKLGLKFYYMGAVMRDIARKRGITLNELDILRKTGPAIDKEVDDYLVSLGKTQDNLVIDSRTAAHFIPQSIKIFLEVDLNIAAERILKDMIEKGKLEERNEKAAANVEDQAKLIEKRMADEREIYRKLYDFDLYDKKRYDFCLDTTNMTVEDVRDEIVDFVSQS